MSNPRKPASLKVIAGTDRPDREVADPALELPLVEEVPPHPAWLPNALAVAEWNRLAPILHANKLLTETGVTALGHLCAIHGKMAQLYAAGETPTGHMMAQYRGLVSEFGLTGKVRPGANKEPANKFARFGKRPA